MLLFPFSSTFFFLISDTSKSSFLFFFFQKCQFNRQRLPLYYIKTNQKNKDKGQHKRLSLIYINLDYILCLNIYSSTNFSARPLLLLFLETAICHNSYQNIECTVWYPETVLITWKSSKVTKIQFILWTHIRCNINTCTKITT